LVAQFLAPDILEAILDGRQPPDLTFDKLTRNLPLRWSDLRKQLGFCAPGTER
jgi:site-specific DNA recombinase